MYNKNWCKKVFSSDIPLDFHELIQLVSLKYLMHFLTRINTK